MSIIKTFIVPHPPIIIPEIGKGKEKEIKKTIEAYHKIAKEIAKIKPDTIIISSPHSTIYADYFHISPHDVANGDFSFFGAEDVKIHVRYDHDLRLDIVNKCKEYSFPAGIIGEKNSDLDHGTMIPLYFINKYYNDFKLIRISPSGLEMIDHYNFGKLISELIPEDQSVVWIASGDLSHKLKKDGPYGLAVEGSEFDKKIQDIITSTNFYEIFNLDSDFCYKAAECGLGSITMMLGTLDEKIVKTKILSYQDNFGVGYLVAELTPEAESKIRNFSEMYRVEHDDILESARNSEDEYISLARMSLEYYIQHHEKLNIPKNISDDLLKNRAGIFVSLHIGDSLRGCVGTIYPSTESIAEEIIQNAISAGTKDYRFNEVEKHELEHIVYSVDVLMPPEKIISKKELNINKYGVIVRNDYKTGLLLPNIDGINSIDEQISIAKRKAGISENEPFTLERFEVIRHG